VDVPHQGTILDVPHDDDLYIQLLGDFRVRTGVRDIVESDWPLRRARNLVKLLALAPGYRSHREQLMELLWPEQGQEAAANNLHKALHTARHVLEPHRPNKAQSRYLQLQGDLVALRAPGTVRIDVEEFQNLAELARVSNEPDDYEKALSMYSGDLLPQDAYEDWAILSRERLKHLRLEVLLQLAQLLEQREELVDAIETLRQILEIDRAHEEAHGRLMVLLARTGRRQLALREYMQLQSALEEELGAEPDPAIQKLFRDIQANRLPSTSSGHSLPVQVPTSSMREIPQPVVIGREQEVAELCKHLNALEEGVGNLVILQGETGTGKTYLLAQIAQYAARKGIMTLAGSGADGESHSVYRQLVSALGSYADSSGSPSRSAQEAAELARMLTSMSSSTLGRWNSDATNLGESPPDAAVVDFFRKVSLATPALLIFDDLQLGDEESLRVVETLTNIVDEAALLIVVTVQPPESGGYNQILGLLQAFTSQTVSLLSLHPLGYSETVSLVTQVLGAPADRSALELIHSLSGGLPHFARETAVALAGRGGLQLVEGQWVLRPDMPPGVDRDTLRRPPRAQGTQILLSGDRVFKRPGILTPE